MNTAMIKIVVEQELSDTSEAWLSENGSLTIVQDTSLVFLPAQAVKTLRILLNRTDVQCWLAWQELQAVPAYVEREAKPHE